MSCSFSQRWGPLAACGDDADAVERVAMATVTETMEESAPVFTRMKCEDVWACEGARESEKCTFMLTLKEASLADGLVICALPCQRKDTFGLHLSDGDHIKHAILDKQGKKGKGLHPNAKIFTFSGACLCKTHCFLDRCLLERVKRTLLLNIQ